MSQGREPSLRETWKSSCTQFNCPLIVSLDCCTMNDYPPSPPHQYNSKSSAMQRNDHYFLQPISTPISHPLNTPDVHRSSHSLNVDPLTLNFVRLRHQNAKNTILHASLNTLLINSNREAERARELSNTAFRNPVLGVITLLLLFLLGGDCCFLVLSSLIFHSRLMLLLLLNSTSYLATLDSSSWWSASGVRAFGPTFDSESLIVGELHVYILLLNARQIAMKFIAVLQLLDVELGCE